MEDILKYENREKLYGSLLTDLNLKKVDEKYDAKAFGNFYVTLAAKEFSIRYVNDRHFLSIEFLSNYAPPGAWGFPDWQYLGFLKNYVNKAPEINPDDKQDNATRIAELNNFLKENFELINDLLNKDNYRSTMDGIDTRLKEEFKSRHPGAIKD